MEMTIQTSRLRLRTLKPADAEKVYQYRSLPEVARYQGWEPACAEEVRTFLESLEGTGPDTPGKWHQLGIELLETGTLAGDCGIQVSAADPRQVEIGITLAPAFQHRGLALETLRALLGELFSRWDKHRVFGSVDPRNTASMALLRRAGMRQEAHFVESYWSKGEWADDVVFGILAREWPEGE
jgi:RimJ/RimL family protein N-acetyltransferase